ncbi:ribonuclease H protein [Pyrus ussuriensis x Pyrus communis]|uniref:Ribonuclease H protein n=1 Tax=Pyrus ussuriensis x Pyrus communis TaxID=2448454 RepID=A0A5N5EYL5_9ROSA|nr:ribonuclease H protein [Pyrus ussuriensis x Pyrus communis]
MWRYTRNRVYSVKSGYMVAQEMNWNGEFGQKWVGGLDWRIFCRNNMVFDKAEVDPSVAVQLLRQHWNKLVGCDGELGKQITRGNNVMNYDGAWCSTTGVSGFGWVVRDFAGIFQGAGGAGNIQCVSSAMAEAEALRAALGVCVERGFGVV